MRAARTGWTTSRRSVAAVAAVGLLSLGLPTPAAAAPSGSGSGPAASAKKNVAYLCGAPAKGHATCFSMRRLDVVSRKGVLPATAPSGHGPADLASAYNLPPDGGAGQTVAIVDAFDNPNAEADLAIYRSQFGLPPCTTANGCFTKVNQRGGTTYPPSNTGWAGEISLDIDMVSAVAPRAHILLVEADDTSINNFGASVNEAVALGAKYVSNSYGSDYTSTPGSGEDPTEVTQLDAFYHHPGVAVVASSGDSHFGVSYPAASQYVTSVGGTSLVRDSSTRGWSESVWNNALGGPGSGCSLFEAKPAWQTDSGCSMRTVADVSAVADPETGVAVYDTFGQGGWSIYGGTSVAAPIITGIYADSGTPLAGTNPASYPYANPSQLNDVTTGNNGNCSPSILCTAGPGYDGPTGLGTPNGLEAFTTGPHGTITGTVTDSATHGPIANAVVTADARRALTDVNGRYTIWVPVGTYTETASAFGYNTGTVNGVVVTDGGFVTQNFALVSVPKVTVSGVVGDASGQGWPLYAAITVDGVPGGPVYTSPVNGSYSMQLPTNATYTLHVTPVYTGYRAASASVTVGSSNVTQNFPLTVDPVTCDAAGYTEHTTGTVQTFDTTSTPAGWSVINNTPAGGWEFDDPGAHGNLTGGTDGFAIVDSDFLGAGNTEDTFLVSPSVNFTGIGAPDVSFDNDYHGLNSTGDVDYSIDGGATWTNVWEHTSDDVRGPSHFDIPLTGAANQPNVRVRFHYTATWAMWWEVDNVFIGSRGCDPDPGGLVVGSVTDANTGNGIAGATVTSVDAASDTATTTATPDDPNLGDGFYWMFSTLTGSHGFSASRGRYQTQTTSTTVAAHVANDVDINLKAGRVTITPSSIIRTVSWQGQATQTVTVNNVGGVPATVNLSEQPGGFALQSVRGAPVNRVNGKFSPLSLHNPTTGALMRSTGPARANANPAAPPWTTVANYPTPIQDNDVVVIDGKVYSAFGSTGSNDTAQTFVFDPVLGAWAPLASAADTREKPAMVAIGGLIYATGGWGGNGAPDPKLEIYDPGADTWTTGASDPTPFAGSGVAVLGGKMYIVGGCTATNCGVTNVQVYDPSLDSWSSAAAYPEAVSWESCGAISGKLYCAGGVTDSGSVVHTYVYSPGSDSWFPMADMPAGLWGSGYTAAEGKLLVSGGVTANNSSITNQGFSLDPNSNTWTALPNSNNTVYRGGSACGFYKVGGIPGGFSAPLDTAEVLPGNVDCADVPWLSESTNAFTIPAGGSVTVTVTLNANDPSVTQPGTYMAKLVVGTDTPYAVPAEQVSMVVTPPKTWGKITGTVSSAFGPLAGATVQIVSGATTFTLRTDRNGVYGLWLLARTNVRVTASKDGFVSQVKSGLTVKTGGVTVVDFTLATS